MIQTYLEIFKEHYPNVVLKEFYGKYCPAGFFKYGMDMHHPDCSAECDKCWLTKAASDDVWCESGDYEIPEEWKGISAPAQTEAAVFDMQTAEQTADVFNYAVLSAEMGDYLKRKEEQLKNEYMNFTANCGRIFAEAQEKLAGDNHYNGVFEKWIKSMGFAKSTVYRMIDVHRFYSSQIGTSKQAELFNNLSKSLQYEIAKPSAPPELVDKVMSGDITTHKEYIALKKELEEAKKSEEKAKAEYEEVFAENNENSRKLSEQLSKNTALQQQIKELESRPRDVAVQSDSDAERKFSETIRKINLDFELFRDEADKELADMRNQRNKALDRAEAAEALLNAPKEERDIKPFLIRMTMDDFTALHEAVRNDPRLKNILTKAQVIRI